eukprot:CAMPEP_0183752244 /NCGR_PEP_ID=MMETSP0739-20130205/2242_1 /TAXON_ID=385413 /ORGANISM="Thalassiosira miniscula, Strain CCMP1093" /LENGTH=108 /DNA_ID=CAMNT_0025988585 /DNA_START=86 /DNA_END=412 /DNA_ORIENTATION=+
MKIAFAISLMLAVTVSAQGLIGELLESPFDTALVAASTSKSSKSSKSSSSGSRRGSRRRSRRRRNSSSSSSSSSSKSSKSSSDFDTFNAPANALVKELDETAPFNAIA